MNETTAIVYGATRSRGKSAVVILGGGSPKNFLLQTKPQLQEILGLDERGHDYFIQITTDSPQWGGLSGATPREAVSWGKIARGSSRRYTVVYCDATIALPILAGYVLTTCRKRKPKRLYSQLPKLCERLEGIVERTVSQKGAPKRKPGGQCPGRRG